MLCPISTAGAESFAEAAGWEVPEIRAYKLGKQRWSYNQVELVLVEAGGGGRSLTVAQATSGGSEQFSPGTQGSAVAFHVELSNGVQAEVHTYLVFDTPQEAGPAQKASSGSSSAEEPSYRWTCVGRDSCSKGCKGPLLRAIQRFGKLGKRAWNAPPDEGPSGSSPPANKKDPRFMYLSFDEAGTHVGARTFRLLAALHDASGSRLLATAVSPPIRVFANNDVPTGAAHIQLMVEVSSEWEGWADVPQRPDFIGTSRAVAARREQPQQQQPARAPPLGLAPQAVKRQPARAAAAKGRARATPSSEDSMTDHTGSHSSSGDLLESGKAGIAVRDTSRSPDLHARRRLKTEHHVGWQPQKREQQQRQRQRQQSEEQQRELQRELSLRQLPTAGLLQHQHTPSHSTAPSPKAEWGGARLWFGADNSAVRSGDCGHHFAGRMHSEAVAETPTFGYRREQSRAPAGATLSPQDLFGLVGMGEAEHHDDPIHAFNELMALIQIPQPHTPGAPGISMALAAMAKGGSGGGGGGAPISLSAVAGALPLDHLDHHHQLKAPQQRLPQLFQGSPGLTPPKHAAHPSSRSSSEILQPLSGLEEDPFARGLSRPASIDRMLHNLGGPAGSLSPLRLPTASPTNSQTPPSYLDAFFTGQPEVWHRHN